jgi:tRNA threonylcarbamoyladenosine dehydratase
VSPDGADLERRFGGLQRLYGDAAYARLRGAHVVVVGLGGVGSWSAEALARSGVARLSLIDMDHVSESNINRQIQALGQTVGLGKAQALLLRIADIHPGCVVDVIDDFVTPENWPALLAGSSPDAVIDACDQASAKLTLAQWSRQTQTPCVTVGAAGGKQQPQAVKVSDLADATHDPLLAALRQRLRKLHAAPRSGPLQIRCVYSTEPLQAPAQCHTAADPTMARHDGGLNCHGYGSSVMVTATFGMVAAAAAVTLILSELNSK